MTASTLHTFLGITYLTWICIFIGTAGYMLQKYLEQYLKEKSVGVLLKFRNFFFLRETLIPIIVTIILDYFLMLTSSSLFYDPYVQAGIGGMMAYSGYAFLRMVVLGNKYLKLIKDRR